MELLVSGAVTGSCLKKQTYGLLAASWQKLLSGSLWVSSVLMSSGRKEWKRTPRRKIQNASMTA